MKKPIILVLLLALLLTAFSSCHPKDPPQTGWSMKTEVRQSSELADLSVQAYIYARLKTEEFLQCDPSSVSAEELRVLLAEILSAYDAAADAADAAGEIAEAYELSKKSKKNKGSDLLVIAPFALGSYAGSEAADWANRINAAYEKTDKNAKNSERIRQLAEQLGTDARSAAKQLQTANEIIAGDALDEAAFYNFCTNAAMVTKTSCKVALFACGVVASGGTIGAAGITLAADSTALATAATVVSGADALLDVGATGSTIILGEDHTVSRTLSEAENAAGAVSSVLTLGNLVTSFDPKKAQDVFDGVNFLADTAVGLVVDNKILGVTLGSSEDQKNNRPIGGVSYEVDITGKTEAQVAAEVADQGGKLPEGGTRSVSSILNGWSATAANYLEAANTLIAEFSDVPSSPTASPDASETPVPSGSSDPADALEWQMNVTYLSVPAGVFRDPGSTVYKNTTVTLVLSRDGKFTVSFPAGYCTYEATGPLRTYTYTVDPFTISGQIDDASDFFVDGANAIPEVLSASVAPASVASVESVDYDPSVTYISVRNQTFSHTSSPNVTDSAPSVSLIRNSSGVSFSYYSYCSAVTVSSNDGVASPASESSRPFSVSLEEAK